MSQRREKKVRLLERRVAELEGENQMLHKMLHSLIYRAPNPSRNYWLYKPYSKLEIVGPDGSIKADIASSLDYMNAEPMDAQYTPISSDKKPGFFQRLKEKLFG